MKKELKYPTKDKIAFVKKMLNVFEGNHEFNRSKYYEIIEFNNLHYYIEEEDEELIDTLIFTVDNAIFFDEEDYCGMSQKEVCEYVEKGDMVELYFKDGIPNTFHIIDDYDIDESFETLLLYKMVAVYKRDTKGNWVVVWKKEVKSDA